MTVKHHSIIVLASMVGISLVIACAAHLVLDWSSRRILSRSISADMAKYNQGASAFGLTDTPFVMDGQLSPEMLPSRDIDLPADKRVIVIEVGGQYFAYPLSFMNGIGEHIVNDCFHGTPISVIYCDLTDCVRVLTKVENDQPLRVHQNGFSGGELDLRFEDFTYRLSQDTIPLERYPFEIVNWSSWCAKHPDGLVYPGVDWDTVMAEKR